MDHPCHYVVHVLQQRWFHVAHQGSVFAYRIELCDTVTAQADTSGQWYVRVYDRRDLMLFQVPAASAAAAQELLARYMAVIDIAREKLFDPLQTPFSQPRHRVQYDDDADNGTAT